MMFWRYVLVDFFLEASFNWACGVVGVAVVSGVAASFITWEKKNRTGLVIGVINAIEPEPEESERFRFLLTLLNIIWLSRLWSSENQIVGVGPETKEWTNHNARSHTLSLPKFFHLYSPKGFVLKSY